MRESTYLHNRTSYPDTSFIRRYRHELMDHFFAGSNHLVSATKYLEKQQYGDIRITNMEDMLENLRCSRFTETIVTAIKAELLRRGRLIGEDDELSPFTRPVAVDLTLSIAKELPLTDFQREAVIRSVTHFLNEDKRAGVLVMPAGARVITVTGCINTLISRVLGTFSGNNLCFV